MFASLKPDHMNKQQKRNTLENSSAPVKLRLSNLWMQKKIRKMYLL